MVKMWDPSSPNYVEPMSVLTAMKTVFPAFRGFQQHDSQVMHNILHTFNRYLFNLVYFQYNSLGIPSMFFGPAS